MKKHLLIGFLLGVTAILSMAAQRAMVGSELATPNFPWATAATWLAASDEATALGVTERTFKTITTAIAVDSAGDGKIVIYNLPYGTNGVRIRTIGLTPDDVIVFDVLSGTFNGNIEDCAMVLRGTLTFTVGTQTSATASYELADIVVLTADSATTSPWVIANPGTGSETCAEVLLDMQGDDRLVLVPTSLTSNAFVLIKSY